MAPEPQDNKAREAQFAQFRRVLGPVPVLASESKQAYDEILAQFLKAFEPQGFMQHLMLHELMDCTWKMARYTRNTALLMYRRFHQLLAFQSERRDAVSTNKNATVQGQVQGRAEHTYADAADPEDLFDGLVEEIDAILLKDLPEAEHFRALEVGLAYQDHFARAFNATAARRDDILERIDCHRPSLGGVLRGLSDEIIATEMSELGSSATEVAGPTGPIPPEAAASLLDALGIKMPRARIVTSASPRRIEANRANGRKSKGPRTAEGKASASRNALRHGLATITRHNPKHFPGIEQMAKALCNGDDNPLLFEQALIVAENELVLRCVGVEQVAAIERMRDITARPLTRRDNSMAHAKARFRAAKLKYAQLVLAADAKKAATVGKAATAGQEQSPKSGAQRRIAQTAKGPRKGPRKVRENFDAVCLAQPDLDRLARYERRAWSRQKRAIRTFIEIKSSRRKDENAAKN